ncbi:hypothetical protein BJF79_17405 [Actinomadura sp. CNU-125]|uniref:hypothetical protein n=1 Tax=Actinomadura sp. CNU-125 TaxID=1904961 RepID=UPI000959A530|nr:hypothetical protein [Actinomadura sp. CNU-125]OLT18238.1 hypothetical protein BJF79_17405 [Actinomadura sp. CNU-125]
MGYYVVHHDYEIELPEKPIDLWCKDELWKYVKVEQGAKIEILRGEIHVQGAPAPSEIDTGVHPLQYARDMEDRMEKRIEKLIADLHARRVTDE